MVKKNVYRNRKIPGFSDRLRECILKCPLSPTQIENTYGINHSNLSSYTSGDMVPGIYNLSILAKICGVTTDYLIYGDMQDGDN